MSKPPLTPREVYQVLRDLAIGVRTMRRLGEHSWVKIYCGLMTVETDGWVLTFYNDCDTLDYCDSCYAPDGRAYIFDSSQFYGTDPVELMSTWELQKLEKRSPRLNCRRPQVTPEANTPSILRLPSGAVHDHH